MYFYFPAITYTHGLSSCAWQGIYSFVADTCKRFFLAVFSAQSFTEDVNHDQRLPALSEEQRAPSSSVILPKKALRMQGANKGKSENFV